MRWEALVVDVIGTVLSSVGQLQHFPAFIEILSSEKNDQKSVPITQIDEL